MACREMFSYVSYVVNCGFRVLILKVIFLLPVTLTKQVAELHGLQVDFLISLFQEMCKSWLLELLWTKE